MTAERDKLPDVAEKKAESDEDEGLSIVVTADDNVDIAQMIAEHRGVGNDSNPHSIEDDGPLQKAFSEEKKNNKVGGIMNDDYMLNTFEVINSPAEVYGVKKEETKTASTTPQSES